MAACAAFAIAVGVIACRRIGGDSGGDLVEQRSAALDLGQLNVLMRSYDNSRSGANLRETVLTQANVGQAQFGRVFQLAVDDQIYAQLLYTGNITIGGVVRDVVYAATVNNSVYAFDAAAGGAPIWQKNYNSLGNPPNHTNVGVGPPFCTGGYNDMSGNIGIIGTPAIDGNTNRMYFVTRHLVGTTYSQVLHAIDITTGNDVVAAKNIAATIAATGDGSSGGNLAFDPRNQNQRPALALAGGQVYIAWAGHCDTAPYHGWVMTYDATNLNQTGVFNTAPNGKAAGIWMSGGGPVIDGTGVYYSTGNGWGDTAQTQAGFGESVIKFSPLGSLTVASSFTAGNFASLNNADNDLGVGGMAMVPGTSLIYTGSKALKGYLLNTANLGGMTSDDHQIPQVFQAVDTTARPSDTHHNHSTPVMWQSPQGLNTYIWAENDFMRAYRFNTSTQTYNTPAVMVGTVLPPVGMPGGFMTLSANGSTAGTGILWTTTSSSGDANHATVPGILQAFNAETLTLLWDSSGPGNDMGNLAKYNPPLVAEGSVFVPSFSNVVSVYRNMATETALPRSSWVATASNTGGTDVPAHMLDSVTTTRWSTGTAMTNGMWFQVDLGASQGFNQITMDSGGNVNDYARGYQVLVSSDGANFNQVATGTGTSPLITVNFTATSGRYVKVVQTGSTTHWWSIVEFNAYTATPPPQPPSGLTATAASMSAINLAWTASPTPGVTYNVFRSTTSTFTPSASNQIASGVNGLTYGDSALVGSTTYYYYVKAVNSTGTSSASNEASATTSPPPAGPSPPSNLTATAVSSSAINLSWTASPTSGVTYTVFRSTTSTFTPSENNDIANGLTGTTYGDNTGLTGSTTYFYVVQAVNAGTSSVSSNQVSATTQGSGALSRTGWVATASNGSASAPLALDNNTATRYTSGTGMTNTMWFQVDMTAATTFNQITMNSAGFANDYARGYQVLVSSDGVTFGTPIASGNGTAALITVQFATQTARYLRVNQTTNTPANWWSIAEFNVYGGATPPPPPQPPSALSATATSSSNINLSWTASPTSGVTYSVFRGTSASFTPAASNQIASALAGLTYGDSALSGSTTYYYYVQAVNGGVASTSSNEANATTSASSGTKINCGGVAVSPFVADVDFTGGATINHANTIDLSGVTNPAPAAVYQTARTATFSYTIPGFAASSSHTVRLHFAETYFSAAGARTFNVSINGAQVLSAFDIFATAGAQNKAIVQQFTVNANSSGSYVIQFTTVVNSALISGIEVL